MLDSYNLRARLFPAILGIAPAIALAAISISWNQIGLPQVIATVAVGVLFFTFSDIARRFGKRTERNFFRENGGRPFPKVLRHRDDRLDRQSKARYRAWLAEKLDEKGPTEDEERDDPMSADAFYDRCGIWLRERTRDTKRFQVLFEENITYGFRRNLYGLKWPVLALNIIIVFFCIFMLTKGNDIIGDIVSREKIYAVLTISALHALYFILFVTCKSVTEASNQYDRQLILCSETLMDDEKNLS